jgi:hypothetical protein
MQLYFLSAFIALLGVQAAMVAGQVCHNIIMLLLCVCVFEKFCFKT